jgi:hypothetical protein
MSNETPHDTKNPQGKTVLGVEIFKAGRHKPMSGAMLNFMDSDLVNIARSYDPDSHPAPVVIGHPQADAPAYGWVTGLRVEGNKLVADFGDIDPDFADLVKAKRYRKISASFWSPNASSNPTPGAYTLKHVGFLGAAAPAVTGLKDAEFKSSVEGVVEFGDDDIVDLPEHHQRTIARHHHDVALEKLIFEGRLLPIHKDQMLDFVSAIDDGQSVSFSDGATKGKADWILEFIAAQPPMVQFGAMDMNEAPPNSHKRYDIPSGFTVDPDRQGLTDAANQMAQDEGISFSEAVQRLGG